MQELLVIHRTHESSHQLPDLKDLLPEGNEWIHWRTCLRQIAIGMDHWDFAALENAEIYRGEKAYQFLLEIISGLHSPLVAETEVLGQFKNIAQQNQNVSWPFQSLAKNLLSDVKPIRTTHLKNLGSQSYGSVARRMFNSESTVVFMGAGQLTQEILPWLSKEQSRIIVLNRSGERLKQIQEKFPKVEFYTWEQAHQKIPADHALVVAAPLSSGFISDFLQTHKALPQKFLDLREDSHRDVLPFAVKGFCLKDVFAEIAATRQVLAQKVELARKMIAEISQKRALSNQIRPFGWDDLWL